MKIKLYWLTSILIITTLVFSVTVAASMLIPANDRAKENARVLENSPVITETESGEWDLERVDFIHYVKSSNPSNQPKTETCYKLLGVKWSTLPVNYIINPVNPQGLTEDFVTSTISTSAEIWDAATMSELFNNVYTVDYNVQYGVQNFVNTIAFGDYPDNNVIAVTSIWYTRRGKQIVEFDQLYNTRYTWGDAVINPSVMDLQNIVTHELGHGVGLGDIYSTACSTVTMYGYSNYGETSKRSLGQPDITGLQKMYGA
ncbi:matrixin family metalloprotease [Candidatus Woesearchaeota archaeon]|nr:matrixin family metalloprotease [Candidatus Woesearchaeota archaeon]